MRGRPGLVVGLVGASRAGKPHLLAAMIAEIVRGGLRRYGLTFAPVDHALHAGPKRVQLLALVAMAGALPDPAARGVGRA